MNKFRSISLAALVCVPMAAASLTSVSARAEEPVTYVALVWTKSGGAEKLADYENRFRAILGKWNAQAKPVAVVAPKAFNTQDPNPFAYRLPDRIDVVTFPDSGTWPKISVSKEWRAIKPIREEALEQLVIMETKSLVDKAH